MRPDVNSELEARLREEIQVLERWLAAQHMGTTFKGIKGSSVSLIPIVESLIETRRMLLANLESAHKELKSSNALIGKN
jgi:hypothetical protein